ncbi:hypothetical protein V6Z12_D11G165200 [Gossypium hirsutum]
MITSLNPISSAKTTPLRHVYASAIVRYLTLWIRAFPKGMDPISLACSSGKNPLKVSSFQETMDCFIC